MDTNYVKMIYIRNIKCRILKVISHFESGEVTTTESKEKEFKIKRQIQQKKMVFADPIQKIELICEENNYHETYEMEKVKGIEIRYYSVTVDNQGNCCVLRAVN